MAEGLDMEIYAQDPGGSPILLCRGYCESALERWMQGRGASAPQVFIQASDLARWRSHLNAGLEDCIEQDRILPEEQFTLVREALEEVWRTSFSAADVGKAVAQSQRLGRCLARVLQKGMAVSDLFHILRHDFDTFSHTVNVASYCVLLAQALGMEDRDELEAIAVGGLLHDLGKRHIPRHILLKSQALNATEKAIIRRHPQQGYEELRDREELSFGQRMMAYQHHERVDGRGYPVNVVGQEIHPWARLCAVCDVFDALTGRRPYRRPASTSAALAYVNEHAGTHFDREMATCWTSASC